MTRMRPGNERLQCDAGFVVLMGRLGSATAGRARDLATGKLPPKLSDRIADVCDRQWPTQRRRWRFSYRVTGPHL